MQRRYHWFLAITLLAWTPLAGLAQPLPNVFVGGNHWTITFLDDTSVGHTPWATQRICFFPYAAVGTHVSGLWYSTSYPDWNGRYTQEGDQVKMHGDFQYPWGAPNGGHDGMTWDITTARSGAGEWKEWIETPGVGVTVGWGNATWTRIGVCPSPPLSSTTLGSAAEATAALSDDELEKELLHLSLQVPQPCLADGVTKAEKPLDRRQVACK